MSTHHDTQVQLIDQLCAKQAPIRLGQAHTFKPNCNPVPAEQMAFVVKKWGCVDQTSQQKSILHNSLLQFGGHFTLIHEVDDDLNKLLARGQLWGPTGRMLKGEPSRCHSNSVLAWEANQNLLFVATGYAMSADGLWRQHSWCVLPKSRSVQIVETTEPRELYFGFVMTLEETIEFGDFNTDFGVEVQPATYARYGLTEPAQESTMPSPQP